MQNHVENYEQLKFKINEIGDSRHIKYTFREMSAIIAKIEEITADIPEGIDELNIQDVNLMQKKLNIDLKEIIKLKNLRLISLNGSKVNNKDEYISQLRNQNSSIEILFRENNLPIE